MAIEIRPLTSRDIDGALTLSSTAGWNQQVADWRMLLQIAPAGCFAAVHESRIVGTAIGIDYGAFGWIAMMLVEPAYRNQGLGAQLLESAMNAIPPGHPIRLDATPLGRPLYQRYGFVDERMLTRFVREPGPECAPAPEIGRPRRNVTPADLRKIQERDVAVFGANRRTLLDWALGTAPGYAHVIEEEHGYAYCFGRHGRLFAQVGPVVAADERAAVALAAASLAAIRTRAVVDAFEDEPGAFTEWLRSSGFERQRPLYRMCRPSGTPTHARPAPPADSARELAIFGPEFA